MNVQLSDSLLISAVLFVLGTLGFLTRRNLIVMFLSAELMLQAVALNLIAFGRAHGNYHGQSFTVFVLTVAACEAGMALVLFLALYQRASSLDVSLWHDLGETDAEEVDPDLFDAEGLVPAEVVRDRKLTPAGREPALTRSATTAAPAKKGASKRG